MFFDMKDYLIRKEAAKQESCYADAAEFFGECMSSCVMSFLFDMLCISAATQIRAEWRRIRQYASPELHHCTTASFKMLSVSSGLKIKSSLTSFS